jgi:hypothetical protein
VTVIVEPFLAMRQMGWKAPSLIAIVKDASLVKSMSGGTPIRSWGGHAGEPMLEDVPVETLLDDPPPPPVHAAPMSVTSAIVAMTSFRTRPPLPQVRSHSRARHYP